MCHCLMNRCANLFLGLINLCSIKFIDVILSYSIFILFSIFTSATKYCMHVRYERVCTVQELLEELSFICVHHCPVSFSIKNILRIEIFKFLTGKINCYVTRLRKWNGIFPLWEKHLKSLIFNEKSPMHFNFLENARKIACVHYVSNG